jgi:hypothetical protein
MRRTAHRVSVALLVCSVVMAGRATPLGSQSVKDNPKPSAQSQKYVRPTDPSLYVGAEVCKTCHEDLYNTFATSPHFATTIDSKLDAQKGPEWHGCEACHGPGKEHVEGGGDKTKIFTFKDVSPAESSARCLDCHHASTVIRRIMQRTSNHYCGNRRRNSVTAATWMCGHSSCAHFITA